MKETLKQWIDDHIAIFMCTSLLFALFIALYIYTVSVYVIIYKVDISYTGIMVFFRIIIGSYLAIFSVQCVYSLVDLFVRLFSL